MDEAENLIYSQGQAIFKYLGRIKYFVPESRMPRMAYV
jgi:hypothetical protein